MDRTFPKLERTLVLDRCGMQVLQTTAI